MKQAIPVYLQNKYHMGGASNVNVTTIWSGSSNVTSLLGAFLADTYLGRFRTLLFGTISSLLVNRVINVGNFFLNEA